jgi:hypothetical protein
MRTAPKDIISAGPLAAHTPACAHAKPKPARQGLTNPPTCGIITLIRGDRAKEGNAMANIGRLVGSCSRGDSGCARPHLSESIPMSVRQLGGGVLRI